MEHITGYVTATARDSKVLYEKGSTFVEQIMPGAFARAIDRAKNICLDLDHDRKRILADVNSGTLTLCEDNIGLRAEADIEDEEVIEMKKTGRLRGWSFEFMPVTVRTEKRTDGMLMRYVVEMELYAVTLVSDSCSPAYSGTQIDERCSEIRCVILDELEQRQLPPETKQLTDTQINRYNAVIEILKLGGKI